jgi:uncharacterized protein YjbI with pentapeptide repeats
LLNPSVSRMEAPTKKPKTLSHGLFYKAHMPAINLNFSDLTDADFSETNLIKAELSGANLTRMRNFSAKQIKSAKNWASATHNGKRLDNPEVFKQLGLNAKP